MRIDGKVFRWASGTYFFLHCLHFILSLIGSFMPFYGGKNLFAVYEKMWPMPYIGLFLLAVGCFCAWRTLHGPHYCLAVLLIDLIWPVICAMPLVGPYLGAAIMSYFEQSYLFDFGMGHRLLSSSIDCIILVDSAFVIYMLVLLFHTPKNKVY